MVDGSVAGKISENKMPTLFSLSVDIIDRTISVGNGVPANVSTWSESYASGTLCYRVCKGGQSMSSVSNNMSSYLHTYEAYRIPKGHEALGAKNAELIKTEEGSELILTEASRKQLLKDREKYNAMLFAEANMAAEKTQIAAKEKQAIDEAKIMAVVRAMSKGDIVPPSDEKKVMEYDGDLYQAAKMAQTIALQAERHKRKSLWDEEEEEEFRKKMDKLNEEANELSSSMGGKSEEFAKAQEANVVEVDMGNVDLSKVQYFVKYSGNVGGAILDMSV